MDANAALSTKDNFGVHEYVDQHGNHGTEVVSQRQIKVHTARVRNLFDPSHDKTGIDMTDYFNPGGKSKRKVLVVVDSLLPEAKRTQIKAYFEWCKTEKLLDNYTVMELDVQPTGKTFQQVSKLVTAAKQFRLKRRDLLIGIASTMVTDIVGFAAAIYRRSTPWILVPTDPVGIIHSTACDNKLSVDYTDSVGITHKGLFALNHPPIASFYDPSFLDSLHEDDLKRGLAEIVKSSVHKDGDLFSYVEAHLEKMLSGTPEAAYLATAVEGAARAAVKEVGEVPFGNDYHRSTAKFGDVATQAIANIKAISFGDAASVAVGIALASALSFLKRKLCSADLSRVLNLLEKAGLLIYDEALEASGLWEYLTSAAHGGDGDSTFIVPMAIGKEGYLKATDLSLGDISEALSILRKHCREISGRSPESEPRTSTENVPDIGDGFQKGFSEQVVSEDVQYHVVSVPEIFSPSNTTLIEEYCIDKAGGDKRKILVVVDDYFGNAAPSIDEYFKKHSSKIDEFGILSMHVTSNGKNMDSVLRVVDATIGLNMTQRDLLIVVGGGTLMDIVGFAASFLKGGIPYLRIPTTLIGMIDAGIGVKTGVNVENHKTLIGGYYAPVACLNDPGTFLVTLPRREFACGLAEAIKMALLKSSRLFEVIERYHRNIEYNTYTYELIQISIHTMLEELQPNLYEHDLRRLVDFGHEFGHIIESLARYEIPHGECVAIGMALSTSLACMKGIILQSDLERILNCILDSGLPIYAADYGCCDPDILWDKIRTEGIEHKDGMLWLAVPESIGRGSFLDNISDIDAGMVSEAILSLRLYADQYRKVNVLRTKWLMEAGLSMLPNGHQSLPSGTLSLSNSSSSLHSINTPVSDGSMSLSDTNSSLPSRNSPALKGKSSSYNGEEDLPGGAAVNSTSGNIGSQLASYPPILCLQHPENFKSIETEDDILHTTLLKFVRSGDGFRLGSGVSPITDILELSLNRWFNKLQTSQQELLTEYVNQTMGLSIRLRSDPAMAQIAAFTIEQDSQHNFHGFINFHAGLATSACHPDTSGKLDDLVGHEGYHLLAFLSRGRRPLSSNPEVEREQAAAKKWQDFLRHWDKPYVILLDVGATYLRVGTMGPHGLLLDEPTRIPSPGKQSYPQHTLAMLQESLLETLVCQIDIVKARHRGISFGEVGISFGAVITREGVVEDASILWNDSARGYDFKKALLERLPGMRLTILNDISAAAWRYKDEGRFCLVTVSSGLSNKVFNPDLRALDQLELDAAGVGGEMGHVIVEPRAVDALVQHAILQATNDPEELSRSRLNTYVHGNAQKITAQYLGMAVKERDEFAMRLLEETGIPYCPCGNLADLCSYSSGRGALRHAQRLASHGNHGIAPNDITHQWLQQAITTGHPLALKVLYDSTYPLALRILQLAADIGLDKFIIVGGFAMRTGERAYLQALQHHLIGFCHQSAFFGHWDKEKVRGLVRFGVDDDNDGLIGMGHFVQHSRAYYHAVEKAVGVQSQAVVTRSIPRCGAQEVLAKVVFSGICTTDLQILSGERGFEPTVLGHEGVFQVLEVGKDVRGLNTGEMIMLNPNNPLDDYDKLGHTREGVFQEYLKFGQEFLEREQVLKLGRSVVRPTDTLIEPLSTVVAAQERIKNRIAGSNILIIGAGRMGLLFVTMMARKGASNVFLANRSKARLKSAVTRGIIHEEKVFVIDEDCISSQVDKVSAGKGVDIVIICVSRQGVRAAQDAIAYVNPGGCVYLFAGFRAGDVLALDGGAKVDVWSIRSGWKTERIQIANKPVDLSGHRGSRTKDLAVAADVIRSNRLSFGKMISHIISLNALPDIMLTLTRDRNIQGMPAQTVVVDMAAQGRVVESAEEFPLRHLHEATRKQKDAIPMGNLFREIGFQGNTSLLGWVCPPPWQEIKVAVETALKMKSLSSKRHFIWVGTGPWVFLLNALKETMPASGDIAFHTLQTLDPQALEDLFELIEDLSVAVCLGMSQSGKTLETVILMNALRERFDSARLDYREHFVWLTDTCNSIQVEKDGEGVIPSLNEHDWKQVDIVPLTVGNHSDINALFCAPHSMMMFLPLAMLLGDSRAMQDTYQQYLALRDDVTRCILPQAHSVAFKHIENIQMGLDGDLPPAMVRLVTQLVEQSLGSKQSGFNPRVCVASNNDRVAGFELVALPMPPEIPTVVKVMLTMNALSTFVAMVAYHREIQFVTHPKVDLYKQRAMELMATSKDEPRSSNLEGVSAEIVAYLNNNHPRTRFVDVLYYGQLPVFHRLCLKAWLSSYSGLRTQTLTQSTSIDVFPGEEWNHSRYQAAVQREDTVYVILVPLEYNNRVDGISKGAVCRQTRTLQAIARATYETLLPRALYFRIGREFPREFLLYAT